VTIDDTMLRRDDPVPLYAQIRDRLVAAIKSGEIEPGDRLPSEPELVQMFRVGRPTVRQAVGLLRQEGWVTTQRGLGTFVVGTSVELSMLSFDGLTQVLHAQGLSVRDEILSTETADQAALEVLRTEGDGQWWIVRRLREIVSGDHQGPLCVETDCFPLAICPNAPEIFERTGSATAVLEEAYGYRIATCEVVTRAVRVPAKWRKLLGLAASAPVLAMERMNRSSDGTIIHAGSFIIRTDLVPLVERLANPALHRASSL
jgi:DNA-binding GntR family transcriptional regulator